VVSVQRSVGGTIVDVDEFRHYHNQSTHAHNIVNWANKISFGYYVHIVAEKIISRSRITVVYVRMHFYSSLLWFSLRDDLSDGKELQASQYMV
jgi:hypothetical protein